MFGDLVFIAANLPESAQFDAFINSLLYLNKMSADLVTIVNDVDAPSGDSEDD